MKTMEWVRLSGTNHNSFGSKTPAKRSGHTAVAVSGCHMFVFGGFGECGCFDDMWLLTLLDECIEWTEIEQNGDIPCARNGHTCCSLNSVDTSNPHNTKISQDTKLIVFGGLDTEENAFNDLVIFDCATNTWEEICTRGERPSPRRNHCAQVINRKMVVQFGYDDKNRLSLNDTWILDIDNWEWTYAEMRMLSPLSSLDSLQYCSSLYCSGKNMDNQGTIIGPQGISLARDRQTMCVSHNNKLIMFGGWDSNWQKLNGLYVIDRETQEVREVVAPNPPKSRYGHTATVFGNYMIIFAGVETGESLLGDVHILNMDTFQWMEAQTQMPTPLGGEWEADGLIDKMAVDMGYPGCSSTTSQSELSRFSHSACMLGNRMVVFGGWDGSDYRNDVAMLYTGLRIPELSMGLADMLKHGWFSDSHMYTCVFQNRKLRA